MIFLKSISKEISPVNLEDGCINLSGFANVLELDLLPICRLERSRSFLGQRLKAQVKSFTSVKRRLKKKWIRTIWEEKDWIISSWVTWIHKRNEITETIKCFGGQSTYRESLCQTPKNAFSLICQRLKGAFGFARMNTLPYYANWRSYWMSIIFLFGLWEEVWWELFGTKDLSRGMTTSILVWCIVIRISYLI